MSRREDLFTRLRWIAAMLLCVSAVMFVISIWTQDARWAMTALVVLGLSVVSVLAALE